MPFRYALQAVGALLAIGVTVVHVRDQGGISAFADPAWMGWGYRLLEVGGIAVALALLAAVRRAHALLWVAAALLAAGPFVGFVLSRTTGVPGDSDDKGNWSDPVGTASLIIEGLLVVVAVVGLWSTARRGRAS